jgi:hypothetical protein
MEELNFEQVNKDLKKKRVLNYVIVGAGILAVVTAVIVAFCVSVPAGLFSLIGYPICYLMGLARGWCCKATKILKEGVDTFVANKEDLLSGKVITLDITDGGYQVSIDEAAKAKKQKSKKNTIKPQDTIKTQED